MSFIIFLKIEKIIKLQALVYISERTFSLKEVRWKKERKKKRKVINLREKLFADVMNKRDTNNFFFRKKVNNGWRILSAQKMKNASLDELKIFYSLINYFKSEKGAKLRWTWFIDRNRVPTTQPFENW
jgi:hypothetical protein